MRNLNDQAALRELERLDFPAVMTDSERQHFENLLVLRAYVLGWTGDPLQQTASSVLAAFRQMQRERSARR